MALGDLIDYRGQLVHREDAMQVVRLLHKISEVFKGGSFAPSRGGVGRGQRPVAGEAIVVDGVGQARWRSC